MSTVFPPTLASIPSLSTVYHRPSPSPHLSVNFCPAITGAVFFSGAFFFPHTAHAFARYAHLLQYFLPDSILVTHSFPVHLAA